jgi:hypothetical protein
MRLAEEPGELDCLSSPATLYHAPMLTQQGLVMVTTEAVESSPTRGH